MEGRGLDNRPIETKRGGFVLVGEVIVCFETGVGLTTEGVVGLAFSGSIKKICVYYLR